MTLQTTETNKADIALDELLMINGADDIVQWHDAHVITIIAGLAKLSISHYCKQAQKDIGLYPGGITHDGFDNISNARILKQLNESFYLKPDKIDATALSENVEDTTKDKIMSSNDYLLERNFEYRQLIIELVDVLGFVITPSAGRIIPDGVSLEKIMKVRAKSSDIINQ